MGVNEKSLTSVLQDPGGKGVNEIDLTSVLKNPIKR